MTNVGTGIGLLPTTAIACECLNESGILHIKGPEIHASDLVSIIASGQIGGYGFGPSITPEISFNSWISLMVFLVAVVSISCLLYGGGKLIIGEINKKAD